MQEAGEETQLLPTQSPHTDVAVLDNYGNKGRTRNWRRRVGVVCACGALATVGFAAVSKSPSWPRASNHVKKSSSKAAKLFQMGGNPSLSTGNQKTKKTEKASPNIVFILLDDQGYNDMGPESSDYAELTPHVDALAADGIWLSKYYGQETCTPARAALLTGIYPMHTGMQYGVITANDPWGLPTAYRIMPQYLKAAANYTTHMVGKWHLGHFAETRLPLSRGFDTFFGFFSGFTGYFTHVSEVNLCKADGAGCWFDLRNQMVPVIKNGEYREYMFERQVRDLFNAHGALSPEKKEAQPFFLYYAMGNVHQPIECPEDQLEKNADKLSHIVNIQRRIHACMTVVMDDSIGKVVSGLKENKLYDDTLLVVASDNGANAMVEGGGSNWPLRGKKSDYFEGGIRVHALLRSASFPQRLRGTTYDGLFHVTDWLPTIVNGVLNSAVVLEPVDAMLDGVNHWKSITTGATDGYPRVDLVHAISPQYTASSRNGSVTMYFTGAIRHGDFKLLVNVLDQPAWTVPITPTIAASDRYPGSASDGSLDPGEISEAKPLSTHLFNIQEDPTESTDLKGAHPEIYELMMKSFYSLAAKSAEPQYCGVDDTSDAAAAFGVDHFVGPWRPDNVDNEKECLKLGSPEALKHYKEVGCIYSLFGDDECDSTDVIDGIEFGAMTADAAGAAHAAAASAADAAAAVGE